MKTVLLGLLAETFIHPGAGQTSGVIDLPVSREAATDYPFIPGSSLKGALKEVFGETDGYEDHTDALFGLQESAGDLLISDARLLLLPVRSLHGAYKWVTCPHLLERFNRDRERHHANFSKGLDIPSWDFKHSEFIAADSNDNNPPKIFLEERSFSRHSDEILDGNWIQAIRKLINNDAVRKRLSEQLIVLSDDDFVWFARYGLAVQARNKLQAKTKASENLWYEESLPPDTLMYTVLAVRNAKSDHLDTVKLFFYEQPWLQVGGNETVGQGWFKVTVSNGLENGS